MSIPIFFIINLLGGVLLPGALNQSLLNQRQNLFSVWRMCSENYFTKRLVRLYAGSPQMLRGVLLPGAPDRAYLINKLIKQQEQIYHLHL